MPVFTPTFNIASAALSSVILVEEQVFPCELMPMLAMCFGGVNPASHIFCISNRFEVFRINTQPITAQMVNDQSGRNWPNAVLIRPSVREHTFPRNSDSSVSAWCGRPIPVPAIGLFAEYNLRPESFMRWAINPLGKPSVERIPPRPPPLPMHRAPTPRPSLLLTSINFAIHKTPSIFLSGVSNHDLT